tara:strand:- start:686 stop:910 length:225 start_codon:yes stop_codon:yes gene_type:complete
MKLTEFKKRLNHYQDKVTFTDVNDQEHFLYEKFVVLDDNGNVDYNKQSKLYKENELTCYNWIKENKKELLTKNK